VDAVVGAPPPPPVRRAMQGRPQVEPGY